MFGSFVSRSRVSLEIWVDGRLSSGSSVISWSGFFESPCITRAVGSLGFLLGSASMLALIIVWFYFSLFVLCHVCVIFTGLSNPVRIFRSVRSRVPWFSIVWSGHCSCCWDISKSLSVLYISTHISRQRLSVVVGRMCVGSMVGDFSVCRRCVLRLHYIPPYCPFHAAGYIIDDTGRGRRTRLLETARPGHGRGSLPFRKLSSRTTYIYCSCANSPKLLVPTSGRG